MLPAAHRTDAKVLVTGRVMERRAMVRTLWAGLRAALLRAPGSDLPLGAGTTD